MTSTTPTKPIPIFIKLLFGVIIFATLVNMCSSPSKKQQTAKQPVVENPQSPSKKSAASSVKPKPQPNLTVPNLTVPNVTFKRKVAASSVKPKPKPNPTISNVTFRQFNRLFAHNSGLTDLQKDEEWKKYQGLCIEWTGELAHLDQGIFGGISIGMKHLKQTLTYDVLIDAPSSQKDVLLSWQKGTRHTYRATLTGYGGAMLPISADWGCKP